MKLHPVGTGFAGRKSRLAATPVTPSVLHRSENLGGEPAREMHYHEENGEIRKELMPFLQPLFPYPADPGKPKGQRSRVLIRGKDRRNRGS